MVELLLSACGNLDETPQVEQNELTDYEQIWEDIEVPQQEKQMTQNEQTNKTKESTLFEILDGPSHWEDGQVHGVDWEKILPIIKAGVDVNQKDEKGFSLFARVITAPIPNAWGTDIAKEALLRTEVVKELLKRDVSIEQIIDEDGNTAFMVASRKGQMPIVEMLLKHGANVNATNDDGNTALMIASANAHLPVVEMLLKHGTNVNATNKNGSTALMLAVGPHYLDLPGYPPTTKVSYDNHAQIVQALLQVGANVTIKNKEGKTALMFAQDKHTELDQEQFYQYIRSTTEDEERNEIIILLEAAGAKE